MRSSGRADANEGQAQRAEVRATRFLLKAFKAWGQPEAAAHVRVEFSPRMTSSLGRCYPERRLIRLHQRLQEADNSTLLNEVVCHEAAHIVALERHGPGIRPHGPEWEQLVEQAGVPARVSIPCGIELSGDHAPDSGTVYEHRCPVCHTIRRARRPVRRWRCAPCVEAGLPGELVITSRPLSRSTDPSQGAP